MTDAKQPLTLPDRENAAVEFKTTLSDSRKIIETIAAMATIGGGTIWVGVRPDGTSVGCEVGEGELERLVQRILAATDPKVYVELDDPEHEGQRLLRIRVPAGDGAHLAYGRAFHRVGPATVAMTRDEYERRLVDRLRESSGFERRSDLGATLDDVDSQAIARFRERTSAQGDSPPVDPRDLLYKLHLVSGDELTVGGALLFALDPQRVLPQAVIRARATRGVAEDSEEIGGNLFDQILRATAFVSRNLRTRVIRDGVLRQEVPELPVAAVREVVANAVAHRDYRSTAPIQLRLNDEGLSVWSPGHLPPPITPALLRQDHPSIPPNPYIARALHRAGFIEEWGTGTLLVMETLRAAGLPEPLFEEDRGAGVRVQLPMAGQVANHLSPRQKQFLDSSAIGSSFTTAECAASLGVSHSTALNDLRAIEAYGLIERRGQGKSSRWIRR
jgi:ATP-dependent DNA helicase RecG